MTSQTGNDVTNQLIVPDLPRVVCTYVGRSCKPLAFHLGTLKQQEVENRVLDHFRSHDRSETLIGESIFRNWSLSDSLQ